MRTRDDVITLWAMGVLVAIAGSLIHEGLGHSLVCIADGGHVTLLTFLIFRCAPENGYIAAAGPLAALVMGALSLMVLTRVPRRFAGVHVFLMTLGVLLLFWTWAQLIRNAVQGNDDWGWVARDFGWSPLWHWVGPVMGVAGYLVTMSIATKMAVRIAPGAPDRLVHPWLAAIIAAIVLGGMWHGGRIASALDGFMTFGVAALGYLLAIKACGKVDDDVSVDISRNWLWILLALLAFIAASFTIGLGVGSLA